LRTKQFPEIELGPPHVKAVIFVSLRFSYNLEKANDSQKTKSMFSGNYRLASRGHIFLLWSLKLNERKGSSCLLSR
jgi:hypothetical protein